MAPSVNELSACHVVCLTAQSANLHYYDSLETIVRHEKNFLVSFSACLIPNGHVDIFRGDIERTSKKFKEILPEERRIRPVINWR